MTENIFPKILMILAFHLRAVFVLDDAVGNESWFFCIMGKTSAPFRWPIHWESCGQGSSFLSTACGELRSPSSGRAARL